MAPTFLLTLRVYDPESNTWTTVASMNIARYSHTATLLPNGKVLVTGGYNGSLVSTSEVYDPQTNEWTNVAPLNTARDYHTATLLPNGTVLVAGGYGINSGDTSVVVMIRV